jgi:ribosomal protein S18 acetylase RimI-like enzyme
MTKVIMNHPVHSNIRPVIASDLPFLKTVIDTNDLFPSQLLDEMTANYLMKSTGTDFWFTYHETQPIAVAYFAPERMTSGTYNLYLIAVHAVHQGKGIGTILLNYVEKLLSNRGERILLVETSGLPAFERTRGFYKKTGYTHEARIREFYAAGEDKIVFWKSLVAPAETT